MGEIPVYTQTIYLNELFLHKQMGLQVFFESKAEFAKYFNAESLVEVISHELAHAILTDTSPKSQETNGGHGQEHDKLTEQLGKLLKTHKCPATRYCQKTAKTWQEKIRKGQFLLQLAEQEGEEAEKLRVRKGTELLLKHFNSNK